MFVGSMEITLDACPNDYKRLMLSYTGLLSMGQPVPGQHYWPLVCILDLYLYIPIRLTLSWYDNAYHSVKQRSYIMIWRWPLFYSLQYSLEDSTSVRLHLSLSSHRIQVDTQQMRLQSLFIKCETKWINEMTAPQLKEIIKKKIITV